MRFALHGARVVLRDWRDSDLTPFAVLNADSEVRRYFPSVLTQTESNANADHFREHADREGFTFWAVEVPGVADFIGFTGLLRTPYAAHFTPCVEIGWRLAREYWGRGYATEAAKLALEYGFQQLQLDKIVAITTPDNLPSQSVMTRIGMARDLSGDFDHPNVPAYHPLRRHVLYHIHRARR
ncbi:GNAT family N-acetyltransferase [Chitinimonas sp. BJB300]|uniref:GNAT family N-acetyltransferase n=1 Tax=Chitinimonas sp. BJB300 TaxID=1559339 RepID=UPI000C0D9BCA|nr:GNAT family N-acetyltransferase [Chitinimonas sp. BJB300]PHV13310.1 GNAT family N-acetyltransferase [Chitinimonas sp. BJB300]TSJ85985.1 GNAT family N-acetyltransferase [Chitinimonas sp. BJB300]